MNAYPDGKIPEMSCFRYFFAWFDREKGFLFSHKTCFPLFVQCIKNIQHI